MKFFSTSEVDASVGDKIRPIRNAIEAKIRLAVINKNYGNGILDWGHIVICAKPEDYQMGWFKEIKNYSTKKGDLDLRLRIDYEDVIRANEKEMFKLICKSILSGIDIAENELKIPDFDFVEFRKDMTGLFAKEGWI